VLFIFQVPVPGNGHENVRANEKHDCPHMQIWMRNGRFELGLQVNGACS
jgi:hypothetical protein